MAYKPWNRQQTGNSMKLKRETYLEQIRPFYEADLIKVITGVRRAGKSVLTESIRDELVSGGIDGDHVIYVNFEDMDYEYIKTSTELNDYIKSRITDTGKYYIFLDEIQHVNEFEKALASFRATMNSSIFVAGSNSKLLAGELATLLTGRTVEFEILPFSFFEMKEYFELNNREFSDDLIFDYIKWGGFPVRFDFRRDEDIRRYLRDLYSGIVEKDIKGTGGRLDSETFSNISLFIMANAGKEFSPDNIVKYYNASKGREISRQTVYNYLERMQKAFLIHAVQKYNIVGKTALTGNEKYYAVDSGFRIINTNSINYEDTFFLENVVYNELLTRGFTVYTGKTYKGEVDFVAIRGGKKCFIQVSYLLSGEETIKREFGAFSNITDASPKYVLSLDKIDMSHDGIAHVNIVDFLLRRADLALT